MIQIIRCLN